MGEHIYICSLYLYRKIKKNSEITNEKRFVKQ